jgi:hypothetical protein
MLSQNFSFDGMPDQFLGEISQAIGRYWLHLGRGRYRVFVVRHWLEGSPPATVALLRMSNHQDLAAWPEVRQSFELPGPEWAVRCCRKYGLRSLLEPQKLSLAERPVAVAQEAAAGFLGNLDAVDLVFAKDPGD